MYIVCKNRECVANLDNVLGVGIDGCDIVAPTDTKTVVFLGHYKTKKRAKAVFEQMLAELFPTATIVLQNMDVSPGAEDMLKGNALCIKTPDDTPRVDIIEPRVFYMPEE